jgi:8-oxo-dGTP pyrophosphatase MutT (NUDIX family)
VALAEAPPASIEAIPEQEPLATRFGVNSQGLIDVVPDPPAPETAADALQREFYEETRLKAQALVALGSNQLGDLSGPRPIAFATL